METRKKKKRIIILSIIAFVVALLLAGVLYYIFKPDKGDKIDTLEVAKGNVIQTLDKTAAVSSREKGDFILVDGVVVKHVNVKVGQMVKKGDVLATFDISSLQKVVEEKQDIYNTAKAAHDRYLSSSASASGELQQINKKIADLEAKIEKLEKQVEAQKNENNNDEPADATDEQKSEIEKLKKALNKLIDDTVLSSKLIQLILKNSDSAQGVIDALKGLINSMGNSGSVDMSQIQDIISSSFNGISEEYTELIEAQLELAELKTKKATLSVSANDSLGSLYKKVADSAYEAYLTAKSTVDSVSQGWTAKYDGIVSKVDIKEGQVFGSGNDKSSGGLDITSIINSLTSGNVDVTSMLSGMAADSTSVLTVEYLPLTASFTLSKNEVSKVAVGQKVDIVVSSDERITGTVVYKSAVASESNAFDISGMLNGGSASSGGVEVRVEFDEYNSNVIIGFDVEVSIKTDEVENSIVVPIESIQYDNSKAHLFIYDPEEKKVSKTEVTIGLRDDTRYEILSGCEVGDIIIKSPSSTLKDGQKIQSNLIGKTVK